MSAAYVEAHSNLGEPASVSTNGITIVTIYPDRIDEHRPNHQNAMPAARGRMHTKDSTWGMAYGCLCGSSECHKCNEISREGR